VPSARIRSAVRMADAFSARFRFPICRSAQLTPLRTYFRASPASRSITGSRASNRASSASRSWTASQAIRANPARLTKSSPLLLQATALSQAKGVLENRIPVTPSTSAHDSKPAAHASIWASVTCAGSSTMAASIRAS
jgi:hypothetical protein